ncbi:PREDICTED: uncharacterized protein LOC104798454 isoform X2 [Tarenaya hassleriana]|uniref:uncharacterized protein LOC104798454 isoform X2 n=1 Tax=Tarenaya hassleriana TaxID=28532 RepID=UPI00053C74AD|nr:PREDICTED: uncharacterized protein LOC104798454 isoform X2 [Tarenaya hassleriana]
MDEQDIGDWDEEFLEAAIKAEEFHLSSQLPPSAPAPETVSISSSLPQQPQPSGHRQEIPSRDHFFCYSPPRVLSQRAADSGDAFLNYSTSAAAARRSSPTSSSRRWDSSKDLEIDRLKKELGRVSKQLLDLERECSQLRKGRNDERLIRPSHNNNKGQDSIVNGSNRPSLEPGVTTLANDGASHEIHREKGLDGQKCCKTIGVQVDLAYNADLSKKLLDIWCTSSYQDPRRYLISELLLACSTDLQILFSFMTVNMDPQEVDHSLHESSSNMKSSEALGAAKVSQLYSAITEISYGLVDLKALFQPLLDLCKAKNAVIVYRTLHIVHVLLEHICGVERKFEIRDIVIDEESSSGEVAQFHGFQHRRQTSLNTRESANLSNTSFCGRPAADPCKKSPDETDGAQLLCDTNWLYLFELMNEIASRRTEEHVKLEAVSIMNIIVMGSDAYTKREDFGSAKVFESISLLLRKETSLGVRKEAIHLFYLLLNCPKLLGIFDSLWEERKITDAGNGSEENLFVIKAFGMIFEGLAGCLTSPRKTSQDLELCRNVVMVLALLASSGNSGFEVLTSHKLSQDTNFLMLILQLLSAEIDSETAATPEPAETFKSRTQLMREILILLNRLVSAPSSSSTILRELTKSRDMASLTVDAATRLSRKRRALGQPDSGAQRMRESEITDLARIFRRRVFAYLGDCTS